MACHNPARLISTQRKQSDSATLVRATCANLHQIIQAELLASLQPMRVEVQPGQVEVCWLYEMEELLSVTSTRIATMYHNNPVSPLH